MIDLSAHAHHPQSLFPVEVKLRILVVDDDHAFCDLMVRTFELIGLEGSVAHDGATALTVLRQQSFDAVLLDILMPGGMTGLDTCRELRTFSTIPVIMVTALNRAEDVVQSINAGADSVITKPFRFREAQARILAVLRRAGRLPTALPGTVSDDGTQPVKRSANEVIIDGRLYLLSYQEYRLFNVLAARAEQPVSKVEIFETLWGKEQRVNPNLVERVVNRLRARVEEDPSHPQYIVTCAYGHYMYCRRGSRKLT